MNKEEQIKDIIEILELSKKEIESNNENITATLDLQDLKSLKNLYDLYQAEKEKNKKIEDKIKVKLEKLKGQKGQYRLMIEQEYKKLLEE